MICVSVSAISCPMCGHVSEEWDADLQLNSGLRRDLRSLPPLWNFLVFCTDLSLDSQHITDLLLVG